MMRSSVRIAGCICRRKTRRHDGGLGGCGLDWLGRGLWFGGGWWGNGGFRIDISDFRRDGLLIGVREMLVVAGSSRGVSGGCDPPATDDGKL